MPLGGDGSPRPACFPKQRGALGARSAGAPDFDGLFADEVPPPPRSWLKELANYIMQIDRSVPAVFTRNYVLVVLLSTSASSVLLALKQCIPLHYALCMCLRKMSMFLVLFSLTFLL